MELADPGSREDVPCCVGTKCGCSGAIEREVIDIGNGGGIFGCDGRGEGFERCRDIGRGVVFVDDGKGRVGGTAVARIGIATSDFDGLGYDCGGGDGRWNGDCGREDGVFYGGLEEVVGYGFPAGGKNLKRILLARHRYGVDLRRGILSICNAARGHKGGEEGSFCCWIHCDRFVMSIF